MVVVKIYGGLGNQLFQYATGYALSQRTHSPLLIDTQWYRYNTKNCRPFDLKHFNIVEESYPSKKQKIYIDEDCHFFFKLYLRLKNTPAIPKFREKFFHYDNNFEKIDRSICLDGYWQSEKYFAAYKDDLREILTPKKTLKTIHSELLKELSRDNSVALHVRRGDYNTLDENKTLFYLCSMDYYKRAVSFFKDIYKDPKFFIFSDDPLWVKSSFDWLEHKRIISGNTNLEDFSLMRKANHQIIANSTFSWWAAWLCQRDNQKVVAPSLWFKVKDKDTKDLIPKEWHTL